MYKLFRYGFLQFTAGLFGSILGFVVTASIFYFADRMNVTGGLWGDKVVIIGGVLIGLPVGCLFGLLIVDKIAEADKKGIASILLSLISGMLSAGLTILWLFSILGRMSAIIIPLLVVISCMIGYHFASIVRRIGQ